MVIYYNKPHINVKESKADYTLSTINLIEEYQQNEGATDKKYSEHVLQVEGKIFEISAQQGNSVITLKDKGSESSVICQMIAEENNSILKLKKGDIIRIKGVCTGYLLDVIMVRCILVQ